MADATAVLFGIANLYVAEFDATNAFPIDTVGAGDFGPVWT